MDGVVAVIEQQDVQEASEVAGVIDIGLLIGVHVLQGRFVGEPMLRVTDDTRAVIDSAMALKPCRETDGYATFGGVLEGELSVGMSRPSG